MQYTFKVCILHANQIEKDFRLKKTLKYFLDLGAKVTIVTFPWNKVSNPEQWDCEFHYSKRQNYLFKASQNKIWLLRVLWNTIFLWPAKYYSRLFANGSGLAAESLKLESDLYYLINIETVPEGFKLIRKTKKPIIYDSYEYFPKILKGNYYFKNPRKNNRYFKLEKNFVNQLCVSTIVVNDEIAKGYVEEYGCPLPFVIRNVAPERSESIRIHEGISFYFQSYLRPTYNIEKLIDAFSLVKGEAKLVIQGAFLNSEYESELKNHIQNSQRNKDISLLPPCEYENVVKEAAKYDVGIDPVSASVGNTFNESFYYATPNKLYSYLSAGLCLALPCYPINKELLEKYKAGVVFNPDDINDFSKALQTLVDNPGMVNEMREMSFKLSGLFNIDSELKKFKEICNLSIEKKNYC